MKNSDQPTEPAPKAKQPATTIAKGFVMVNLSSQEQKDLRALAHKSGMSLRDALRYALFDVRTHLKTSARVKRLTGMGASEQCRFFNYGCGLNAN